MNGGLRIHNADDVLDLEVLRGLRAIDGKSSEGWSLNIYRNGQLVSLAGLRNLGGACLLYTSPSPRD